MTDAPKTPPDPTEHDKQRYKEAERSFDALDNATEMHFRQIEAFAVLTLRMLALTCAGGIAAVLGFYSANYLRLSQSPASMTVLNGILGTLFIGMLLTLVAAGFAYFSQMSYAQAVFTRIRSYEFPYVTNREGKGGTSEWIQRGDAIRVLATVFAGAAGACLIVAGYSFVGIVR